MENSLPDDLVLDLRVTAISASELADMIGSALAAGELRAVERWSLPREGTPHSSDWRVAMAKFSQARAGDAMDGRLDLGGGQFVDFSSPEADRTHWRVMLHTHPDKENPSTYPRLLECHVRFCRHWLDEGNAELGFQYWIGGDASCLPRVPLVGDRSHVIITTRALVQAAYDQPTVFWRAGWSHVEQTGDAYLLQRAMDITCSVDYLRAVLSQQWALARAAKPKQTRYSLPNPLPEEVPILNSGAQTLHPYGYHSELARMEYTCILEKDSHIGGWEILGLYQLLREGKMPDGSPVSRARVLFYEQWMAEQEKRPLLDIGAQVAYIAADGKELELTK
ncbi:MAG TPA: hypothetical protein VGK81_05665 [Anaerolineae bacterium]|jgi:hypothetical protein